MAAAATAGQGYGTGTRVGRYRIGWLIGQGAASQIYVARDERRQRDVAVKVITEPGGLAGQLMRVRREVRTLGGVRHPNVLRVHGGGQHEGRAYLVTDYATGGSLEERIRGGQLPVARSLSVLAGIARGLDHLHSLGIVHGDVKPANVLFAAGDRPLVADFGVARLPPASPLETPVLRDLTTLVGTPYYMSPEQIRGSKLSGATDQYALAVVAYRLLTGRLPFEARYSPDVMHMHLLQRPRPASKVNPALPEAVDAVLERGMGKDPGDRWDRCAQLVGAIAGLLG